MAQLFGAAPANDLPLVPNYNVCPTNQVHVVQAGAIGENDPENDAKNDGQSAGARHLVSMRWGFLPHWYKSPSDGPLLINARAETLAQKPAFRAACRARRCLIATTGFYEWTKTPDGARLPWYITRRDGAPVVFGAVWQGWNGDASPINTCAIVTTSANDAMSAIHHRMPVILEPEDWALWLGEKGHGAAALMVPAPEAVVAFHRVGVAVNSNRASGPELIEEIDAEGF